MGFECLVMLFLRVLTIIIMLAEHHMLHHVFAFARTSPQAKKTAVR